MFSGYSRLKCCVCVRARDRPIRSFVRSLIHTQTKIPVNEAMRKYFCWRFVTFDRTKGKKKIFIKIKKYTNEPIHRIYMYAVVCNASSKINFSFFVFDIAFERFERKVICNTNCIHSKCKIWKKCGIFTAKIKMNLNYCVHLSIDLFICFIFQILMPLPNWSNLTFFFDKFQLISKMIKSHTYSIDGSINRSIAFNHHFSNLPKVKCWQMLFFSSSSTISWIDHLKSHTSMLIQIHMMLHC